MSVAIKRTGLVIDRVDLVDQGANPDAHILLCKRKEDGIMTFEEVMKNFDEETQALINAEIEKAKATIEVSELSDNSEEIEILKEQVAKLEKELEVAKLAKEEPMEEPEVEDAILKGLPEELRKEFSNMKKKIREMEEEKIMKAFEATASELENLPIQTEELASLLKDVSSLSPETNEMLMALLTASNNAFGKKFEENGSGMSNDGDTGESAYDKLTALAKAKAESSGVTFEKAFTEVIFDNNELYKQYLSEVK